MIRALIFDFDGTIVDTETPEFESWRLEYAVFGVELPLDLWAQLIGTTTPGAFEPYSWLESKIGRALDRDPLHVRRRAVMMDLIAAERPRPGIEDWLAGGRERGLSLAVASASRRPWVEQHLTGVGLIDRFDYLATGDQVERPKPAPDVYHLAAKQLGIAPHEAIVVEDSRHGVAAAKAAGMFTVAVPNRMTAALDFSEADLRVDTLAELDLGEAIRLVGR